jgi:hypothetical protein
MKPSSLAVLGSAILVAACSTVGSSGSDAQGANQVQWKEVTRLEGGQFVTYRVPVNAQVNNNVNMRPFDATVQPGTASGSSGATSRRSTASVAPGADTAKTPPLLPTPGSSGDVTPLFGAPTVAAGVAPASPGAGGSRANLSGEAETALGQAEIAVRDAQSRYETAKAALDRAHRAAEAGDSFVVIEFARSAITLAQPAH